MLIYLICGSAPDSFIKQKQSSQRSVVQISWYWYWWLAYVVGKQLPGVPAKWVKGGLVENQVSHIWYWNWTGRILPAHDPVASLNYFGEGFHNPFRFCPFPRPSDICLPLSIADYGTCYGNVRDTQPAVFFFQLLPDRAFAHNLLHITSLFARTFVYQIKQKIGHFIHILSHFKCLGVVLLKTGIVWDFLKFETIFLVESDGKCADVELTHQISAHSCVEKNNRHM